MVEPRSSAVVAKSVIVGMERLCSQLQAVSSLPKPSTAWSPSALTPCFCPVTYQAVANQVLSREWVSAKTVPAVTDVCLWQPPQTHRPRLLRQPCLDAHRGHMNPSGQRNLCRYCRQAPSSGNHASNSCHVRG